MRAQLKAPWRFHACRDSRAWCFVLTWGEQRFRCLDSYTHYILIKSNNILDVSLNNGNNATC